METKSSAQAGPELKTILERLNNEIDKAYKHAQELLDFGMQFKNISQPEEPTKNNEVIQSGVLSMLYDSIDRLQRINNTLRVANEGFNNIVGHG